MCMSSPSIPAPPAPPPPPPPAPQVPDTPIQSAGASARSRAASMMGPMAMIANVGGPQGLVAPPQTTNRSQLG